MLTVIINRFSELQDRSQQQLFITHKCKIFVLFVNFFTVIDSS